MILEVAILNIKERKQVDFEYGRPEQKLKRISAKSFEKGLVQLHYKK
jgi:hypothetical protein